MRPILALALTLLLTAGYAFADTTAPATGQTASVLVLPFTAPAAAEYQWVGQSVQQVLASDLSHGSTLKVMAPASAKSAADADEALKVATDFGATLVVFGQTQVLDKEIRLTGEILDVTTGRSITGLKATGPIDQLFHLEDAVASQSLNALPDRMRDDEWRDRTGNASAPAPESTTASPSVYDYGSGPYDSGGYYSSYPDYSYYSYPSYPYYYYPYGFYGGVFFNFHDHGDHHDHHDDFHHGDSHDHGDFHGNGNSHGHGDFHSGGSHSGGSMGGGGFSRGSMPGSSTFGGGRGGMTSPGRAGGFSGGGFSGGHAGGFSGGHAGGFSGGGFHGSMGGGGGGFHGGGGGGGGFHGGGGGHR